MNTDIKNEIENLGGDFTRPEWQWLINNGPHGNDFSWRQTNGEPPGYVGVEHLEKIIQEKKENHPSFFGEAREMIALALKSSNTTILIRAIQVCSIIGSEADLATISALTQHSDISVSKNAKASAFYLKNRLKSHAS